MRNRLPAGLLIALASLAPASAQEVSVTFTVEPKTAAAGETVEVSARIAITDGWHIYGAGEDKGIPSKLEVTPGDAAVLDGDVLVPSPHLEEVPYSGTMELLRGAVTFRQRVRIKADATGELSIPVKFSYQACSEGEGGVCLPPTSADASLVVTVKAGAAVPAEVPTPDFLSGDPFGGNSAKTVEAIASLEPSQATAGEVVELRFDVTVSDPWYIYATSTPFGGPIQVLLDLPDGWEAVGPLTGPEPKSKTYPNGDQARIHPPGRYQFVQTVRLAQSAPTATIPLKGKLSWQACDPKTCISGDQAFEFAVDVKAAAGSTDATSPGTNQATAPKDKTSNPLWLIGASIGLGLLMLLMPCTYPMIPITVSLFSKGKTLSRKEALTRAAIYAGGIVISFVVVGGLVQIFFGGEGQGKLGALATNPWVNLIIGVVFVYFALSFFGYYELGLPAPLRNAMQMGSAKQDSDGTVPAWSLFLMGLFFVLTTYTCGAPVIFGLFATAAQDPHPFAILGATFVFALTIAIPFFALAMVPSAMRFMPKSGSWFNVFKAVLGFVELGFAVKFFRGTDLQWDFINLLPRHVSLILWVVLAVSAALLLHGYFPIKLPHQPDLTKWSWRRYAWGWVFVLMAGYFSYGAVGYKLHPRVEAFLLPDAEVVAEDPKDGVDTATTKRLPGEGKQVVYGGLPYYTDLANLERVKKEIAKTGKPVFLLFTGHY